MAKPRKLPRFSRKVFRRKARASSSGSRTRTRTRSRASSGAR